ncbi:MAG: NADPH:quinone oxidoreductase family protein [Pacificimonas sp.]
MTMRALRLERTDKDYTGLALRDLPMPEPGPGEVLVRVRAAAVNFVDLLMTEGRYQYRPDLPYTLGSDFAGDVAATGGGRFAVGDAVMGMNLGGALADHILVKESQLNAKPAAFDYAEAAAFGQPYLTAYVALTRHGELRSGQWILVQGASGGVGLAAVDLAKRMGAKVIAASASDDKLALIDTDYAPDALLNVSGSFRERVKELTGGGADVVYDPVGADIFDEGIRCVAFGGKYLIIGFAGGRIPTVGANYPLIKGFSLVGVRAGEYGRQFPERGVEDRAAIAALAAAGDVKPRVHARFALDDWREAFAMMDRREVVGRVVLEPGR